MEASPAGKGRWAMTLREPVGVIAAITPFNFPLNLAMHKIGPAIAAGNAVVHKPASATPLTALMMAGIFEECGLPPGRAERDHRAGRRGGRSAGDPIRGWP